MKLEKVAIAMHCNFKQLSHQARDGRRRASTPVYVCRRRVEQVEAWPNQARLRASTRARRATNVDTVY